MRQKHFGGLSLIYGCPYFKPVLVQVANTLIKLNLFSNAKNPGKIRGKNLYSNPGQIPRVIL